MADSPNMDTTPLLAASGSLPGPNIIQDHPPFLRASHSPWRWIPQNILVFLRGTVIVYLLAAGAMAVNFKLTETSDYTNWRHLFDFAIVTLALTFIYHVVTFAWTFTHLYYPNPDEDDGGIESWIIAAMSLPRNMGSFRKQFYFTMLYTLACVFSFMNTTIYWFITRQQLGGPDDGAPPPTDTKVSEDKILIFPTLISSGFPVHDKPFSDLFGEGWFTVTNVVNLYAATSVIMVIEILLLNSIKRPYALGSHLLGLIFCSGLYLGWAAIGKAMTGWYAFDWLDREQVGSNEAVAVYCIGFVLLSPIMYILMQGFVGVREGLTRSVAATRREAAAPELLEE